MSSSTALLASKVVIFDCPRRLDCLTRLAVLLSFSSLINKVSSKKLNLFTCIMQTPLLISSFHLNKAGLLEELLVLNTSDFSIGPRIIILNCRSHCLFESFNLQRELLFIPFLTILVKSFFQKLLISQIIRR